MKKRILDLMELSLSAYSEDGMRDYFQRVKTEGLTEHGFPRLASNMGILISHGRRQDLLPLFTEMFDFCCENIPRVKAANDFSVREVISCLWEVEKSGIVPKETTLRWRSLLATIVPENCYNVYAVTPEDKVRNWALFSCVSEFFRQKALSCDSSAFIRMQVLQQKRWLDENGMYRDNPHYRNRQPITYDMAPRGLYSLLFHLGYEGEGKEEIDAALKKAALQTLKMQSPNGENAFGGRSNQFPHAEGWMIAICEYEAKRYFCEGNLPLASKFKAAGVRALNSVEEWLCKKPIHHIKNRFPTETKYGCEDYAYFDKYMITVASNLYAAYLICDESIPYTPEEDLEPTVFETSEFFEKLFVKCGGYGLEFDLDADPHYDACGLGRVHRSGAPSTICLSCPCPSHPSYVVDTKEPTAFSLTAAIPQEKGWLSGADGSAVYQVLEKGVGEKEAFATLLVTFPEKRELRERYRLSADGVEITLSGEKRMGYTLPAFLFDGEKKTEISYEKNTLTIAYEGWLCRYTTSGSIEDLGGIAYNRNGYYRKFLAVGEDTLAVKIEIIPQE